MATLNQTLKIHQDDTEQMAAINYIRRLAGMTNAVITRWNITNLFCAEEGGEKLVVDKKEINKRFFEQYQKLMNRKSSTINTDGGVMVEDIPELCDALDTGFQRNLDRRKTELKYKIESSMRAANQAFKTAEQNLGAVTKAKMEMELIGGNDPVNIIKKELNEVLSEGYWVDPIIKDGWLYLNTKSDITITYVNKAASVNVELNVGQFAAKINMETFETYVIPFKNNIRSVDRWSTGFYHPHINTGGQICWGDALTNYRTWRKSLELGKILKMLFSLLNNYNDGNPYISIQALHSDNTKYGRRAEFLQHPGKPMKAVAKTTEAVAVPESTPLSPPTPVRAAVPLRAVASNYVITQSAGDTFAMGEERTGEVEDDDSPF